MQNVEHIPFMKIQNISKYSRNFDGDFHVLNSQIAI